VRALSHDQLSLLLPRLPHLRFLEIHQASSITSLSFLRDAAQLQHLRLSGFLPKLAVTELRYVSWLQKLETLHLMHIFKGPPPNAALYTPPTQRFALCELPSSSIRDHRSDSSLLALLPLAPQLCALTLLCMCSFASSITCVALNIHMNTWLQCLRLRIDRDGGNQRRPPRPPPRLALRPPDCFWPPQAAGATAWLRGGGAERCWRALRERVVACRTGREASDSLPPSCSASLASASSSYCSSSDSFCSCSPSSESRSSWSTAAWRFLLLTRLGAPAAAAAAAAAEPEGPR
jgi:hypothetical protein